MSKTTHALKIDWPDTAVLDECRTEFEEARAAADAMVDRLAGFEKRAAQAEQAVKDLTAKRAEMIRSVTAGSANEEDLARLTRELREQQCALDDAADVAATIRESEDLMEAIDKARRLGRVYQNEVADFWSDTEAGLIDRLIAEAGPVMLAAYRAKGLTHQHMPAGAPSFEDWLKESLAPKFLRGQNMKAAAWDDAPAPERTRDTITNSRHEALIRAAEATRSRRRDERIQREADHVRIELEDTGEIPLEDSRPRNVRAAGA